VVSDFLLPLRAVILGYRGVFDPEAVSYEYASSTFAAEFWRKTRIVNRSVRTLLSVPQALNPFRVGIFAYQLAAHKGLLWLSPFFLMLVLVSSLILTLEGRTLFQIVVVIETLCGLAALLYAIPACRRYKLIYLLFYYLTANLAALVGILSLALGWSFESWTPDRIQEEHLSLHQDGINA
jgi:hypothetical protein